MTTISTFRPDNEIWELTPFEFNALDEHMTIKLGHEWLKCNKVTLNEHLREWLYDNFDGPQDEIAGEGEMKLVGIH